MQQDVCDLPNYVGLDLVGKHNTSKYKYYMKTNDRHHNPSHENPEKNGWNKCYMKTNERHNPKATTQPTIFFFFKWFEVRFWPFLAGLLFTGQVKPRGADRVSLPRSDPTRPARDTSKTSFPDLAREILKTS